MIKNIKMEAKITPIQFLLVGSLAIILSNMYALRRIVRKTYEQNLTTSLVEEDLKQNFTVLLNLRNRISKS